MAANTQPVSERSDVTYGERGMSFMDSFRTSLVGRTIRKNIPQRESLDILDLGCGYHATYLRALYSKLRRGVGVDFHVSGECKELPLLSFVEESIETALPTLDGDQFDVILFISVLEHVWDPLAALQDCYRVLRKGGVLILHVPTWHAKPILEFSAFRLGTSPAHEMDDHKMYYGKRELWPLLVRAGFKPSCIRLAYQKLGMTLFGRIQK